MQCTAACSLTSDKSPKATYPCKMSARVIFALEIARPRVQFGINGARDTSKVLELHFNFRSTSKIFEILWVNFGNLRVKVLPLFISKETVDAESVILNYLSEGYQCRRCGHSVSFVTKQNLAKRLNYF